MKWLMKSEPDVYSWAHLLKDGKSAWNDVRNYQANNNMKAMKVGDEAFFYHSNIGREIMGIMKIAGPWYHDPTDETGRWGLVDVVPVKQLSKPVTLISIKNHPELSSMALLRQSRLSVSPVSSEEWRIILKMSA